MTLAVVRLLEAVEVEEKKGDSRSVAPGSRALGEQAGVEGSVVQRTGERVAARAFGELARDALDVGSDAAVEGPPHLVLAVALEDASEDEELGRDLGGCETEA